MKRFHRLRDGAAAIVLSLAMVCVSTTTLLPKFAYADEGDFCWNDNDCDYGETCVKNSNPWMPGGQCTRESLQACTEQEREFAKWMGYAGAGLLIVGAGAAAAGTALVASGYALYFGATWGGTLLTSLGVVATGASAGSVFMTFGSVLLGLYCDFG